MARRPYKTKAVKNDDASEDEEDVEVVTVDAGEDDSEEPDADEPEAGVANEDAEEPEEDDQDTRLQSIVDGIRSDSKAKVGMTVWLRDEDTREFGYLYYYPDLTKQQLESIQQAVASEFGGGFFRVRFRVDGKMSSFAEFRVLAPPKAPTRNAPRQLAAQPQADQAQPGYQQAIADLRRELEERERRQAEDRMRAELEASRREIDRLKSEPRKSESDGIVGQLLAAVLKPTAQTSALPPEVTTLISKQDKAIDDLRGEIVRLHDAERVRERETAEDRVRKAELEVEAAKRSNEVTRTDPFDALMTTFEKTAKLEAASKIAKAHDEDGGSGFLGELMEEAKKLILPNLREQLKKLTKTGRPEALSATPDDKSTAVKRAEACYAWISKIIDDANLARDHNHVWQAICDFPNELNTVLASKDDKASVAAAFGSVFGPDGKAEIEGIPDASMASVYALLRTIRQTRETVIMIRTAKQQPQTPQPTSQPTVAQPAPQSQATQSAPVSGSNGGGC